MKIPKSLKIGGFTVSVTQERAIDDSDKYIGLAEIAANRIRLATHVNGKRMCPQTRDSVLLHEIIHHVSEQAAAGLKERQVGALASGLYQVLRDNRLRFY